MKEVVGYKAFNKDLTNRYGKKFEVGKIYIAPGIIKFGNNGNGFHLCRNMEDTFRYFDPENMTVCKVIGSGEMVEGIDHYYGFYEMYAVKRLKILKELSRLEIVEQGLKLNEFRAQRFVSLFPLTEEEIILFKKQFKNYIRVLDAISYHQEKDEKIYYKRIGMDE